MNKYIHEYTIAELEQLLEQHGSIPLKGIGAISGRLSKSQRCYMYDQFRDGEWQSQLGFGEKLEELILYLAFPFCPQIEPVVIESAPQQMIEEAR